MFKFLIMLVVVVVLLLLTTTPPTNCSENNNLNVLWNSFRTKHKLLNEVDDVKFLKFKLNYLQVIAHNQAYSQHNASYKTKINDLSVLNNEEYIQKYLTSSNVTDRIEYSSLINDTKIPLPSLSLDSTTPPDNFDWRTYGLVTSVKEQSSCGSCWAFTATGAIETIYANKFGSLRRFSEQELVDCDTNNWACDGGYPINSFYYAYKNGLVEEAFYPYKNIKQNCNKKLNVTRFKIRGYAKIPSGDEITLKRVVSTYGPVAVALDASDWGFGHYSTGIFTADKCKKNVQNHAVLVVGYGTENNQDFWIVKNSWGRNWGLNGYIKIARGTNTCGIATMASYAYM